MKIAVEGCCHGELDKIYDTVTQLEKQNGFKIDLLIICGDFQSVRNMDDLQAMAVPPKFQKLNTFYKYYSGEKVAPVLTIFIGGNHEASNFLQELPYGGWVARNIYYLGYAGIIQVGGVRIGGISGIYKGHDFNKGHFECPPYDESSKRSVYHVRNLEVFRLKQVSRHLDVFISHDWPTGIYNYGDTTGLLRSKPFFRKEVEEGSLGSKPCADLLNHLKPSYWFAAHLHVKFAAYVEHAPQQNDSMDEVKSTKFLALDKCLPRRKFLQVLDIPHDTEKGTQIKLDPEWLRILQTTNHLMTTTQRARFMPGPGGSERYDFAVTDSDMANIQELFGGDMALPENFVATAAPFTGNPHNTRRPRNPLFVRVNPQTTLLCTMLEITDPNAKFMGKTSEELLEESDIGLPPRDDDDEVDDEDDIEEEDDGGNTTYNPSFINSSMEISQSSFSSNISGSWDGLSKTPKADVSVSDSNATPSRVDVHVADDDEELLSILSAQKSKSLPHPVGTDNKPSSSSPSTSLLGSVTEPAVSSSSSSSSYKNTDPGRHLSPHTSNDQSKRLTVADRLKAVKAKEEQYKSSSSTSNSSLDPCDSQNIDLKRSDTLDTQGVENRADLEVLCSSSQSVSLNCRNRQGSESPDSSDFVEPLLSRSGRSCEESRNISSCTTHTESSGISSVSSSSSVIGSPPVKRDSSDLDSTSGSQSEASSSQHVTSSIESVKKLKRRNVSVYQETTE